MRPINAYVRRRACPEGPALWCESSCGHGAALHNAKVCKVEGRASGKIKKGANHDIAVRAESLRAIC